MNRRDTVLALIALGATPLAAEAQQARKLPVVGFLHPGFPALASTIVMSSLRDGLRDLGYVEGETIKIEARWALGKPETLPGLADELVRLKVDVLVATGPSGVMAAKQATGTLPIVANDLETDPVASGLVASLARPGGNITGLFLDLPGLTGKWLQLLREVWRARGGWPSCGTRTQANISFAQSRLQRKRCLLTCRSSNFAIRPGWRVLSALA